MKIYTLTGDDGYTSLAGGRRVPKHSQRVEAYGSVDELIAWIGLLRDFSENQERRELLKNIQSQLMSCAAVLANDPENPAASIILPGEECVKILEREIDIMDETLPPLHSFILPGGHKLVSYCHIARCVCRRSEREVLRLDASEKTPEIVIRFLNRLSDYLFVLSRKISLELGNEELIWNI